MSRYAIDLDKGRVENDRLLMTIICKKGESDISSAILLLDSVTGYIKEQINYVYSSSDLLSFRVCDDGDAQSKPVCLSRVDNSSFFRSESSMLIEADGENPIEVSYDFESSIQAVLTYERGNLRLRGENISVDGEGFTSGKRLVDKNLSDSHRIPFYFPSVQVQE